MQLIQSASISRLALTWATLSTFDVDPVDTGWARLGITQRTRHISVGVRGNFCSFPETRAVVLTTIEPYSIWERRRDSTLPEVTGIRIFDKEKH